MPPQKYEIVTGIVVATIFFLLAGFFILVLVAFINRRKKKHIEEKQMMQTSFQHEFSQTQLEIQEQTLKTISQEIHDNIGQVLSLAKLNLNTINISKQDDLLEKINSARQLVSKAIQDLRDLSKSLNTDNIAAIGLIKAIEYELDMIRKVGEHQTQMIVYGSVLRPDTKKELILFRIVQEVLHNIIKHAEATAISVQANFSGESMEIVIADNGKGFNTEKTSIAADKASEQGLGIRNMNNRARLIGAGLTIISVAGQGTAVNLKLSLNS